MHWRLLIPFFLTSPLAALYNNNPSAPMLPEKGAFLSPKVSFGGKLGYLCDFVYDRKLHTAGEGSHYTKRNAHTPSLLNQSGVLTLNFASRVELFSTLGTLSSSFHQYLRSPKSSLSYGIHHAFAWGVGGRAILAYWGDVQLGVNASYLSSEAPLSWLKESGHGVPKHHADLELNAWQVGAGASYRFRWAAPYFGIDYADLRVKVRHLKGLGASLPGHRMTLKDAYPFGICLGCGFALERALSINVEGRFFNENAVSASLDFRF